MMAAGASISMPGSPIDSSRAASPGPPVSLEPVLDFLQLGPECWSRSPPSGSVCPAGIAIATDRIRRPARRSARRRGPCLTVRGDVRSVALRRQRRMRHSVDPVPTVLPQVPVVTMRSRPSTGSPAIAGTATGSGAAGITTVPFHWPEGLRPSLPRKSSQSAARSSSVMVSRLRRW